MICADGRPLKSTGQIYELGLNHGIFLGIRRCMHTLQGPKNKLGKIKISVLGRGQIETRAELPERRGKVMSEASPWD